MGQSKQKKFNLKEHLNYMDFLEKRLASKNFKANVSEEEYNNTKKKYDKAKLILKLYQK